MPDHYSRDAVSVAGTAWLASAAARVVAASWLATGSELA
jgi:hypothetical protein